VQHLVYYLNCISSQIRAGKGGSRTAIVGSVCHERQGKIRDTVMMSQSGANWVFDATLGLVVLGSLLAYKLARDRHHVSVLPKRQRLVISTNDLGPRQRLLHDNNTEHAIQNNAAISSQLQSAAAAPQRPTAMLRVLMHGHDTLLEVMSFLLHKERLDAAFVCVHWRSVASADMLWRSFACAALSNRNPRLRESIINNNSIDATNHTDVPSVTQRTADLLRRASSAHRWTVAAAPWNRAYRPVDVVDGVIGWKQLLATTAMCLHAASSGTTTTTSGTRNERSISVGTRLLEKHQLRPHHLLLVLGGLEGLLLESKLCHIALFHFLSLYDNMQLCDISDHHGFVFKVPPPGRGHVSCAHREFRDVLLNVGVEPRLFANWLTPALRQV
jgi:hypothetical protein